MHRAKKAIISVQSQVASGYVGNNIAGLAIQLHGLDPVLIPTVLLSNHVEYPEVYGRPIAHSLFSELVKGIRVNHIVEQCNYLISGYCSHKRIIRGLADLIGVIKTGKDFNYIYDPVCGDFRAGGLYLAKEVADYSIAKLLPLCDILTPNHFELEYILSSKVRTEEQLYDALTNHQVLRSKTVIVTSALFEDTAEEMLEVVLYREGALQRFVTPRIDIELIGTGDLFTAILAAQLHLGKEVRQAIRTAMQFLHATLVQAHAHRLVDFNASVLMENAYLLRQEQSMPYGIS